MTIITDRKQATRPFMAYIAKELAKRYDDIKDVIRLDTIQYKQWDDMDQPGLDEYAEFETTDNRKFAVSMTHHRYQEFKEIGC